MKKLSKYHEFQLTDLVVEEFCILLREKVKKKIIQTALMQFGSWGNGKKLLLYLHNSCKSLNKISPRSLQKGYLAKWKNPKSFLPLDVLIKLCELNKIKLEKIKKHIIKIKHHRARNENAISFKFKYDKTLAVLSEIIKVEGHLDKNLKRFSFINKDIDLIKYVKSLLNKLGVNEKSIYENLRIEIEIPKNSKVRKIINKTTTKELRFYIRDTQKKRFAVFCDKFKYKEKKSYEILTNKEKIKASVVIPSTSKIVTNNSFGSCSATITLQLTNLTLCKILYFLTKVPKGKKSEKITMSSIIWDSPLSIKKAIIGAIIACEGWIETSRIRIWVKSLNYLKDIFRIFQDLGMHPNFGKSGISITFWRDLEFLNKNINLISKEKRSQLKTILSKKKIFKHREALLEIISYMKKHGPVTVYDVKKHLNKHKDTVWRHLRNGMKEGAIRKLRNYWPYKYSLTKRGEKLLKIS